MTVTPSVGDRVLFRSLTSPTVLRAADITAITPPDLSDLNGKIQLKVWGSWPPDEATAYTVADSDQAPDILGITLILPGTWRSIVEVPDWRSRIGS